jgi:hypothetical protein
MGEGQDEAEGHSGIRSECQTDQSDKSALSISRTGQQASKTQGQDRKREGYGIREKRPETQSETTK